MGAQIKKIEYIFPETVVTNEDLKKDFPITTSKDLKKK
jgi:3-oxoacyl-[acyl-carrier-protein] synthase-3